MAEGPAHAPAGPSGLFGRVIEAWALLGGILPGLLCVAALMLMTGWLAIRRNYPRARRWPTPRATFP